MALAEKTLQPELVWNPIPLALARRMPTLSSPLRSKVFERQSNEHFLACACTMQGVRHSMEDRHNISLSLPRHPNYSFFGIYDGHNGSEAAIHLSNNLVNRIDQLDSVEDNDMIIKTIVDMDEEFCASPHGTSGSTIVFALVQTVPASSYEPNPTNLPGQQGHESNSFQPDEVQRQPSTTSNCSDTTLPMDEDSDSDVMQSYRIRVFWAGDSRAVVGRFLSVSNAPTDQIESDEEQADSSFIRMLLEEAQTAEHSQEDCKTDTNGNVKSHVPDQYYFSCMTKDHSPDDPSENKRILDAGGSVSSGRVGGHLAVSRAFGDSNFKAPKKPVVAVCEVSEYVAQSGDFLLLYCDGLVEKLDNDGVVRTLHNEIRAAEKGMFHSGRKDVAYALANLLETSLELGSTDNMTTVLIQLKDGGKYSEKCGVSTYLPGPMYRSRHDPVWMQSYLSHAARFGHRDGDVLRLAAYKEDIRRLKSGNTCYALMRQLSTSEKDVRAREKKRFQNERYLKEVESELERLQHMQRRKLNQLPPQNQHGSGSGDEADEESSLPEATPPLSSDDEEDDDGDIAMTERRNTDLVRRVTDLVTVDLPRSNSLVFSDTFVEPPHKDDEIADAAVPLDAAVCWASSQMSGGESNTHVGVKRQRTLESKENSLTRRSPVMHDSPPSKKRRIEVDSEVSSSQESTNQVGLV